jgi:hypothetical protein
VGKYAAATFFNKRNSLVQCFNKFLDAKHKRQKNYLTNIEGEISKNKLNFHDSPKQYSHSATLKLVHSAQDFRSLSGNRHKN